MAAEGEMHEWRDYSRSADGDRAIRMVLDQALARLGYNVRSTDKAATLWQWIGEGEGDLVITDVLMPDGNRP